MKRQKPGKSVKKKKVNRMSLGELKNKIYELESIRDNSAYLKHLKDAANSYSLRNG